MIAIITPTGGRPTQLALCAEFMKRQTTKEKVLWIIIDDVMPLTSKIIPNNFRENWEIVKVRPLPLWKFGQNTQGRNIYSGITALDQFTKVDAIFIIEDDDYYKANYLEETLKRLDNHEVAGEMLTVYYNLRLLRWHENKNKEWSSLFQTAFRPEALPLFKQIIYSKFIDFEFFKLARNVNLFHAGRLSIGMKGLPGRGGIGAGHEFNPIMKPDADGKMLKELLKEDEQYYNRYCSLLPNHVLN